MELHSASSLSAPHGFPDRTGGVSEGPFSSLNTSFVVGDAPERVRENLARLARAAQVPPERLFSVTQVHGTRVVYAPDSTPGTEADALWTDVPGTAVGVRTADCVPVLIEDPRGRVAAVHAGWRGVIDEIVARTIEVLVGQGARVEELKVGVGPCIQRCCFEVDGDLPARFERAFGAGVIATPPGKSKVHLDLPRAVAHTLERLGVKPGHVAVLPHCTRCDPRFFSHRREQGRTGRHLSFISRP